MKPERLWILMAKKKSGEATREELEELRLLLADNLGSGYSNEIVEKVWQAPLTAIPENKISEKTWQKINERTGTPRAARLLKMFDLTKSLTAASIVIALSLAGIVAYNHFSEKNDLAAAEKNMNHVTTQPGSK